MKKTLGGDRLGSGKKMKVELHGYERSTHDLSYLWRSTMSAGTLVPFMKLLALPGDTFDIDLGAMCMTHPTVGPLFGSFKIQLDVFQCPIRLYQGQLHNNKLGIGMNMSNVFMPIFQIEAPQISALEYDLDNRVINPSAIFSYLGIRGPGSDKSGDAPKRDFNAIPFLAYWDIFKNYYANKMESQAWVIHAVLPSTNYVVSCKLNGSTIPHVPATPTSLGLTQFAVLDIEVTGAQDLNTLIFDVLTVNGMKQYSAAELFTVYSNTGTHIYCTYNGLLGYTNSISFWSTVAIKLNDNIKLESFPISNIDDMRESILTATQVAGAYDILTTALEPYTLPFIKNGEYYSMACSQEGLAVKTYQSDLLQNWLNTEWIDGAGGISQITAIDTSGGSFTIDTLNLSKKVYDMMNRVAVSGGSYEDWLDAVYTHDRYTRAESPIYCGGLSKELEFQEVISNTSTDVNIQQPLGTLAGRGVMGHRHKGGEVTIKVDEPSYIIGIVSLTPRLDYSQGNDWDVANIMTMDDLHKPALDEIGFQELITEQMAWWDTHWDGTKWVQKSAGKQPAWLNYMTNINQCRGNFAIKDNEMFMTLNRMYSPDTDGSGYIKIKDLTTYIDPTIYNQIFADTSLDSQNFWMQIACNITARRKMSAKLMPNL